VPQEHSDDVTYRRARPEEAEEIVALVQSAYRGTSSRDGWTTEADLLDGQRTDVASVRAGLARPEGVILLATRHDTLIGCCQLVRQGGVADFGLFAVRPPLQAQAIGRNLLGEAERFARTTWAVGALRMRVISQRQELIAWYRRRGYELTGEREPFPYEDPLVQARRDDLDFVVLEKSLI
jgi:ribosomal protein S18 acetylase RimI-like enzyme